MEPLCAICVSRPAFDFVELDGDGERYPVCSACSDEHPRSGRYSFEGGKADARLQPGGDGTKRTPRRATGAR